MQPINRPINRLKGSVNRVTICNPRPALLVTVAPSIVCGEGETATIMWRSLKRTRLVYPSIASFA